MLNTKIKTFIYIYITYYYYYFINYITYKFLFFFFFNDTATTEIYTVSDTLSLHDALPICLAPMAGPCRWGVHVPLQLYWSAGACRASNHGPAGDVVSVLLAVSAANFSQALAFRSSREVNHASGQEGRRLWNLFQRPRLRCGARSYGSQQLCADWNGQHHRHCSGFVGCRRSRRGSHSNERRAQHAFRDSHERFRGLHASRPGARPLYRHGKACKLPDVHCSRL